METSPSLNLKNIQKHLSDLPVGEIRYFGSIGSTNDYALRWADEGAQDFSIVIANEQTAGRGRGNRSWFTPAEAALAFSIILRPNQSPHVHHFPRIAALGALAVCTAIKLHAPNLDVQIKWPNDILINHKKTAGILVEAAWTADHLDYLVLGVGVNATTKAIPPIDESLQLPATCIETELGYRINRLEFLRQIIQNLLSWRSKLSTPAFINAWENHLAYKNQPVFVFQTTTKEIKHKYTGNLTGLTPDGFLAIQLDSGENIVVRDGAVHLRPLTAHKNKLNL